MMKQFPVVFVAGVVWLALCCCIVNADESGTTTTSGTADTTADTTRVPAACTRSSSAATSSTPVTSGLSDAVHSSAQHATVAEDVETVLAVEAERGRCPHVPASENFTSSFTSKLHGTWKVVGGYSREFITKAFCPELNLCVDPKNPKKIAVSWINASPYENVIPHGEMTMTDDGNLVDADGYDELTVVKLDQFMILRVCNPNFRRALILHRVSDTDDEEAVESDLFGYLIPTHMDMQMSDGPAWYICAMADLPARSSEDLH